MRLSTNPTKMDLTQYNHSPSLIMVKIALFTSRKMSWSLYSIMKWKLDTKCSWRLHDEGNERSSIAVVGSCSFV